MANKKTSIGGQALLEGIMMRGPALTAMAVRNVNTKEIIVEEFATKGKDRSKIQKAPFIRGIFNLWDSLSFGYKCLMRSAELSGLEDEEEAKKKEPTKFSKLLDKLIMPIATVLAFALAFFLFFYLPTQLYSWLAALIPGIADKFFLRSLFEGIVRILIFVGYVAATAMLKDIRRTYMFHGAEHKTIFCYEAGLPLTVENIRKEPRLHPRCGTSFIVFMLLVGILISMFIRVTNPFLRTAFKILTFPVLISIGYELIRLAGRRDNWFTRIISKPGLLLQKITTREPDDDMIECAIEAMTRVIPSDGSDNW